jgi:hypothetical protein
MKPKYLRHSYQPMCNPLNKIFLGILSIYNLQVVTGFCVFVCMKTLDRKAMLSCDQLYVMQLRPGQQNCPISG